MPRSPPRHEDHEVCEACPAHCPRQGGHWPDAIFCEVPPKTFDKLWVAVRLSGGPLRNSQVDRSSPLRSRPEDLRAVLGSDLHRVLAACVHLLKHVRDIFNKTVDTPGSSVQTRRFEKQRNNRVQTRASMTHMLDLFAE